jgi:indolepyruvate ferredoxin oxidoreductase, beta subunit
MSLIIPSTKDLSPLNFLLVGVGGQGTILASNILAELGIKIGYDVKQAEVHGMSQRGGSVTSNMRWAPQVFSPIIAKGEVDILLAFEKMEAARFIQYLRPGGIVLVNDYSIIPVTVSSGSSIYPDDQTLGNLITEVTPNSYWIKGVEIAEGVGNARSANVVLLGALSAFLDISEENWISMLRLRVPAKYLELNLAAFKAGHDAIRIAV